MTEMTQPRMTEMTQLRRGRLLKIKLGYNANSSSLAVTLSTLLLGSAGMVTLLGLVSAALFSRPEPAGDAAGSPGGPTSSRADDGPASGEASVASGDGSGSDGSGSDGSDSSCSGSDGSGRD